MSALSGLVLPSSAAYVLFVVGLIAYAWARTRRASWWLLASSGLVTIVFSSGMSAAALMSPLEYSSPAVHDSQQFPQARRIVVLTGWAADDPQMPLSGRMNSAAAYRVLMALELFLRRPDCTVIVSGDDTTTRIMGDVLAKMGVPGDQLTLENRSLTTAESARNLQPLLSDEPFFLVTSAGHMPRSLATLRKQGLNAIAAPTDHQLPKDWRNAGLQPSPSSLAVSDLAVHEYVGLLWYRLRGAV